MSSKPVFLRLKTAIVFSGLSEFLQTLIISLNVSLDTVGWSPVMQSAKSELIFFKPFKRDTDKPTSTGLFSINFTESL